MNRVTYDVVVHTQSHFLLMFSHFLQYRRKCSQQHHSNWVGPFDASPVFGLSHQYFPAGNLANRTRLANRAHRVQRQYVMNIKVWNYSFYTWQKMETLSSFLVFSRKDNNTMTGTFPTELGKLTNLRNFTLAFNHFDGTAPNEFGMLKQLVPTEIASFANLSTS